MVIPPKPLPKIDITPKTITSTPPMVASNSCCSMANDPNAVKLAPSTAIVVPTPPRKARVMMPIRSRFSWKATEKYPSVIGSEQGERIERIPASSAGKASASRSEASPGSPAS